MEINWREFIKNQRQKFIIVTIIIGIIVALGVGMWPTKQAQPRLDLKAAQDGVNSNKPKSLENNNKGNQGQKKTTIFIDIKGAVRQPGVYQIRSNQRIETLIALAGGSLAEADLNQINLAKSLHDQEIVYVPRKGEKIPAQFMITNTNQAINSDADLTQNTSSNDETKKQVNLNTASKEDLQTLTGVGPSKAAAIIQYRQAHGGFKTPDDLKQVDGIGEKTFTKLKPFITV